jgi:hypothetical protein
VGTEGSATLDLYNNQRIEIYSEDGVAFKYPNHLCREHGEIFLDYLFNKEKSMPSIGADDVDGLRTIELVFAAYESAQSGKPVEVSRCAES